MTRQRSIVVISMGGVGHVQLLLPVITALRGRDLPVYVVTDVAFRSLVEACGASFVDLFAEGALDRVDATSMPIPCRNVTFAAARAEVVATRVAALAPALILHDTFTVVAPVIARLLGLPFVNVYPNHALVAQRALAALREDPRVDVSEACWAAVERLRAVHGMGEASPFSYVATVSPHLNLYPEPSEFLDPTDRAAMEPLAFFGSLQHVAAAPSRARVSDGGARRRRLYVSFGTVVWSYFARAATAALQTISATLADDPLEVVVSLGGHVLPEATLGPIRRPNLHLFSHVDQWRALGEADVFLTHHGLNSTHEAIACGVPMLSLPFFGDQPALAARCQELGLAIALGAGSPANLDPVRLRAALTRAIREPAEIVARLAQARAWELRTLAGREAILDRLLALAASGGAGA